MIYTVDKLISRMAQFSNEAAVWAELNPILLAGEIGVESDTRRIKVGDGETPWNDLLYWTTTPHTYVNGDGITISNNTINATLLYTIVSN